MVKFIFKWLFRLLLLAVVLAVILILSLDSILRVVVQHNLRAQTGLDAEIGKFHLGLLEPVVEIRNVKLYNPPDFGGTLFLDIPEIHAEYDFAALAQKQVHLTLLRFNLGELDIVKNDAGRTNLFSLGLAVPTKEAAAQGKDLAAFKAKAGLDFKGIDVLNVTVGTAKFIDLQNRRNDRSQNIALNDQIIRNVKSPADLAGLGLLVALRSGDFFNALVLPAKPK